MSNTQTPKQNEIVFFTLNILIVFKILICSLQKENCLLSFPNLHDQGVLISCDLSRSIFEENFLGKVDKGLNETLGIRRHDVETGMRNVMGEGI